MFETSWDTDVDHLKGLTFKQCLKNQMVAIDDACQYISQSLAHIYPEELHDADIQHKITAIKKIVDDINYRSNL